MLIFVKLILVMKVVGLIFKGSFFIMLMLAFSSCRCPLTVLKSTSQQWCIKEKNIKGTAYHIVCKTRLPYQQLHLDSVYIQHQWYNRFHYSVLGKSNTFQQFVKNDSILISLTVMDTIPSLPIYLSYTQNKKNKHLVIKEIKILTSLCTP